ncbi:hypothetical protein BJ684DRAFT_16871, partial [Piptocephalis cylindrospora]
MHTFHLLSILAILVVAATAIPMDYSLVRRDIEDLTNHQADILEDAHHKIAEAGDDEETIADANIEAAERLAEANENAQGHNNDNQWNEDDDEEGDEHLVKREEEEEERLVKREEEEEERL